MSARRGREERGESTLGVLVGMTIGSIVLGGFTSAAISGQEQAETLVSRATAQAQASAAMNRLSRDASDAARVLALGDDGLVLEGRPGASTERVRWSVVTETGSLVRQEATVPPSGAATDWAEVPSQIVIASGVDPIGLFSHTDLASAPRPLIDVDLRIVTDRGSAIERSTTILVGDLP